MTERVGLVGMTERVRLVGMTERVGLVGITEGVGLVGMTERVGLVGRSGCEVGPEESGGVLDSIVLERLPAVETVVGFVSVSGGLIVLWPG